MENNLYMLFHIGFVNGAFKDNLVLILDLEFHYNTPGVAESAKVSQLELRYCLMPFHYDPFLAIYVLTYIRIKTFFGRGENFSLQPTRIFFSQA